MQPLHKPITTRVDKHTKRTVSSDPSIPADDVIRKYSPSEIPADRPTNDSLKLPMNRTEDLPERIPDDSKVDLFDWEWKEKH